MAAPAANRVNTTPAASTAEELASLIAEQAEEAAAQMQGVSVEARLSFWKAQAQEWKDKAKDESKAKNEARLQLDVQRNLADAYKYDLDKARNEIANLRLTMETQGQLIEQHDTAEAEVQELRSVIDELTSQLAEAKGETATTWDDYKASNPREAEVIARLKWQGVPAPSRETAKTICAIYRSYSETPRAQKWQYIEPQKFREICKAHLQSSKAKQFCAKHLRRYRYPTI